MKLSIISSSSAGNCYILQDDSQALIIECGVKLSQIKKALGFNLSKVSGCIVSHRHGDHSKSVEELMDNGVDVYALQDVHKTRHHRAKIIKADTGYSVANFKVFAFGVSHDVPCLGFIITHPDTGSILFLTDTFTCDYTFSGLSHILIECNYADDILEQNINSGSVPGIMRKRLLFSHMELKTTKQLLQAHDLTGVNTITLIHLSSQNSDQNRFIKEITQATGKIIQAATKGMEIDFNKQPY